MSLLLMAILAAHNSSSGMDSTASHVAGSMTLSCEAQSSGRYRSRSLRISGAEWDRIGIDHVDQLPAIQWKLANVRKMRPEKQEGKGREKGSSLDIGQSNVRGIGLEAPRKG
jgi:hypothetical protein